MAETVVNIQKKVMIRQNQFRQMLEHFSQMICWKDVTNGYFIGCNQKFADFVELESSNDIIGRDGYDFFEPAVVDLVREYERKVVEQGVSMAINDEVFLKPTGFTALDVTIAPIFDDNNEITSIIYYGTPAIMLSDKSWSEAVKLVSPENMSKLLRTTSYFVHVNNRQIKLTKREAECSLYILKGLTSKEIAKEMGLASRTIDNYIECIKGKFSCIKRSEMVACLINGHFIDNF